MPPPPTPSGEDAPARATALKPGLNKFLLIAWLVDSVLLVFVFGDTFLHGSTPDRTNLAKDLGAVWGGLGAFLIVPLWKAFTRAVPAPYRTLIYSLLCFSGMAAISAFRLAFATAQGSPNAFSQDMLPLVGFIGTGIWASRSWSAILHVEPDADPAFRQKHKAFGLKAGAVIVSVLVCVISAGIYLGARARHRVRLTILGEQVRALGEEGMPEKQRFRQLVKLKMDPQTLPEYLQSCAELEVAISDYEPTEQRMDSLMAQMQREVEGLTDNFII